MGGFRLNLATFGLTAFKMKMLPSMTLSKCSGRNGGPSLGYQSVRDRLSFISRVLGVRDVFLDGSSSVGAYFPRF